MTTKNTKNTKAKKSTKPEVKETKEAKFATVEQLANHIARRLPWARQTSKISQLRNIKLDPISNGNSLIIWYGSHKVGENFQFRITRNLEVSYLGMEISPNEASVIVEEITKALKGNCYNAKASVSLCMGSFIPNLPALPIVKTTIVPQVVETPLVVENIVAV